MTSLFVICDLSPVRCRLAWEPTGDYHRPIAYRLLAQGFQVVSISSLAVARFREARFGTWDKNDPKDTEVMIAMMEQGMVQVYWDSLFSGSHDWQELSNTYFQITLARTLAAQSPVAPFASYFSGVHTLLDSIGMVHPLPSALPHSFCDSCTRP